MHFFYKYFNFLIVYVKNMYRIWLFNSLIVRKYRWYIEFCQILLSNFNFFAFW
jgi:hypothetical protein